jgi:hypothetical protein
MKVKTLIDKLKYLPQDADVVIVLPKEAVPKEDNSFGKMTVAYTINKVFESRRGWQFLEIGISV